MPFADTGDTTAFTDQFDLVCPFSGSTSPDAWYQYTAGAGEVLVVELCGSAYDTRVFVLDADLEPVGCNDDGCIGSGANPFASAITVVADAGEPRFIVVDGFGGDAGAYELTIEAIPVAACPLDCPPGAILEGEACTPGVIDDFNGGCNTEEENFTRVACGDTVCASVHAVGGMRDTDWYDFEATERATYSLTVSTEFPMVLAGIARTAGCAPIYVYDQITVAPCTSATLELSSATGPGEIGWFVPLIDGFEGYPCDTAPPFGNDYVITVGCSTASPPPCPTLGDADGDGFVDFADLLIVLANFGACP
jgi:hypothetical protein